MMVTTEEGRIFFVCAVSSQCVYHCQLVNWGRFRRAAILSEGRICVGGSEGYCAIFQPQHEIEDYVNVFAQQMYSPLFAHIPFFTPVMKHTLDGIQDKAISIDKALRLVTHLNFDRKSIQEWKHAQHIVMVAVVFGVVPRDRKYENQ